MTKHEKIIKDLVDSVYNRFLLSEKVKTNSRIRAKMMLDLFEVPNIVDLMEEMYGVYPRNPKPKKFPILNSKIIPKKKVSTKFPTKWNPEESCGFEIKNSQLLKLYDTWVTSGYKYYPHPKTFWGIVWIILDWMEFTEKFITKKIIDNVDIVTPYKGGEYINNNVFILAGPPSISIKNNWKEYDNPNWVWSPYVKLETPLVCDIGNYYFYMDDFCYSDNGELTYIFSNVGLTNK